MNCATALVPWGIAHSVGGCGVGVSVALTITMCLSKGPELPFELRRGDPRRL